nr:dUTP diphosphatase [Desulfobacterales bacterium]
MGPVLKICRLKPEQNSDIPLPRYMSSQASGMDLHAAVEDTLIISPGEIALVPTGIAIALPEGFEAQIRPRSGLAVKYGISVINSPGSVDADYRGEIKVALVNLGKEPYHIRRGDRIAQMVIQKVYRARLEPVDSLDKTGRNNGGFGHTGM